MKKLVISKSLIIIAVIILNTSAALADRREIVFPDGLGLAKVSPESLRFAFDDQVGVTIIFQGDFSLHLHSFLVKEGRTVDDINLKSDFGVITNNEVVSFAFIKVHNETGLVIVYGFDSNETQKVVAYQTDQQGHLRPLWKLSFPQSFIPVSALNFNKDGSRICLLYRDSTVHALILDSQEGVILGRGNIQGTGIIATVPPTEAFDLFFSGWINFDEKQGRVVVMTGDSAYLLTLINNVLVVDSKISAAGLGVVDLFQLAFSQDGRFILAAYVYRVNKKAKKNEFVNVSFDLEAKTSREVLIKSEFSTRFNFPTFHPPTGNLFIPLSIKYELTNKRLNIIRGKSRYALIVNLTQDGSLLKTTEVTIPKQSLRSDSLNIVSESSSIEVTAAGALVLLPTVNGRLFMLDTATGEVVNDVNVNSNGGLDTTRLLESYSLILFSTGNRIVLFDVELGPVANSLEFKESRTIIRGANFLSGVRVEIDGKNIEGTSRDSVDPGRVIVIERGNKDFPAGQEFTLTVVNRDNKRSAPLIFSR